MSPRIRKMRFSASCSLLLNHCRVTIVRPIAVHHNPCQAHSHGRRVPKFLFDPPNWFVPKEICFNYFFKTKILLPKIYFPTQTLKSSYGPYPRRERSDDCAVKIWTCITNKRALHAKYTPCLCKGKSMPIDDHGIRLHALRKLSQLNLLPSHNFR